MGRRRVTVFRLLVSVLANDHGPRRDSRLSRRRLFGASVETVQVTILGERSHMTKVASSTLSRKKEVWMDTSKRSGLASWSSAVFLLAACAIVALPLIAEAQQNSCNGSFQINYVAPTPNFPNINDTVRVQLTIGAGTIQGGTQLTLTQLRFDNACKPTGTLGSCATTDADPGAGAGGPPVSYAGDLTIASTCAGVTWASNNPGGGV